MKRKRAGRKRSALHLKRPGSGRPKVYDATPSPQAMAKRLALAAGADPDKTVTPLDLLEGRGMISRELNDAGRDYGWMRRMIFGRTDSRALDLTAVAGIDTGLERLDWQRIEGRYRMLCAALARRGHMVRKATDAVCVYNRFPAILLAAPNRAGGGGELDAIVEGLDTLDRARRSPIPHI